MRGDQPISLDRSTASLVDPPVSRGHAAASAFHSLEVALASRDGRRHHRHLTACGQRDRRPGRGRIPAAERSIRPRELHEAPNLLRIGAQ